MKRVIGKIKTILSRAVVVLFASCVLTVATFAISLEEYKAKVDAAHAEAESIEASLRSEEASDVRSFTAKLRSDFPSSEKIEWNGGVVETSNDWLLEKARALDQKTDSKTQLPVIVELREYLSAMAFKLDELMSVTASGRSKDEDKRKLAEILRREEYQKPTEKQESLFQRLLREFLEWLDSIFPKPTAGAPSFAGMELIRVVLQVLLYGGILALLGFVAYKVVPLIFPNLKKERKPKKKKERIILGEHVGEDVTAMDLLGDADRLARDGDLRGAIRKGYIALLCDLSDRKIIGLAHNKTNRDYLRDVRSRRELHPRMKTVTDAFERHWYGLQDSAEQDWARFREDYKEAIRAI